MKPIRCYTCGKILGNKWEAIDKLLSEKKTFKEIYELLLIRRYCCKRVILTSVDMDNNSTFLSEKIQIHNENVDPKFLKIE